MDVKIITADYYHGRKKGTFGSSTIRGYWLVDAWKDLKYWHHGDNAEAVIYQKVYWKWHMKDFKGIKILDMCDPDWMTRDASFDPIEIGGLIDGVTTSTEALAERMRKWVDVPVVCIPDRVSTKSIRKRSKHEGKAKDVVWYGYSSNGNKIVPNILLALAKRGLSLHTITEAPLALGDTYGVEVTNSKYEYETAYGLIKQSDFCLNPSLQGVNPYDKNKKFLYKSNNKTIIAWALGMPVAETLEDIDKYMHAEERNKEIEVREKEIQEEWDIKLSVEQYKDLIKQICQKKK